VLAAETFGDRNDGTPEGPGRAVCTELPWQV
jgi:hypothetical protein